MIWLNDVKHVKVFKLEDKGNYVKGTLSTGEKKQDGTWENSGWFAAFIGGALEQAKTLQEGDKITITKGKLTNVYNKDKKISYLNLAIFGFLLEGEKPAEEDFSFGIADFTTIEDDDDVPF